MNPPENSLAFGAPGIAPRWTSSAKEGVGTAYHTSCRVWFTLSHGIVNEIYYPHVDQPNTRDFQFLISDGEDVLPRRKARPRSRDRLSGARLPVLSSHELGAGRPLSPGKKCARRIRTGRSCSCIQSSRCWTNRYGGKLRLYALAGAAHRRIRRR